MSKIKSVTLALLASAVFVGGNAIPQTGIVATDIQVEPEPVETEPVVVTETQTTSTITQTTTTTATTTTLATTAITTSTIAIETETFEVVTEQVVEYTPPVEYVETSDTAYGNLIRGGMRGTYYAPGSWNGYSSMGGSGRYLMDCSYGGDGYAKGSIASGYLYNLLGYSANDGRTTVWLNISDYPEMNGLYYLDDCSGADVIDFFYDANANCQFSWAGVVSVDVYYAS